MYSIYCIVGSASDRGEWKRKRYIGASAIHFLFFGEWLKLGLLVTNNNIYTSIKRWIIFRRRELVNYFAIERVDGSNFVSFWIEDLSFWKSCFYEPTEVQNIFQIRYQLDDFNHQDARKNYTKLFRIIQIIFDYILLKFCRRPFEGF